jgi:undecaprenyl diphosphate synthase
MPNSRAREPIKVNQAENPAGSLPLTHVAIIMDGNRRWADKHGLPRLFGHREGVQSLKRLVRHAGKLGLRYLTVYAFSSENWQRSREEVDYLFELFSKTLVEELGELCKNNVRLSFLGQLEAMPASLTEPIYDAMRTTSKNRGLSLQVAINYGSRLEITEAVKKIALAIRSGELQLEQIDDNLIDSYLYTSGMPDPELIIRTGGEMRLSNYLLWQAAYSELYVTPLLWPDFTPREFDKAIEEFVRRERRYGGD